MELSAQYTLPLGEHGTWFTYFGYPGEPALGPVAFMHRMSASENPSATLSHHLQDSTHISFGVLTSGFTYRWLKLKARSLMVVSRMRIGITLILTNGIPGQRAFDNA